MVSVVLPTYNGVEFVADSIESVLNQTDDTALELIVTDDGSTDGTLDVVDSFDDDRITLVHNDDSQGVAANINHGAARATHDIIAFIDQDDVWLPKKLEVHREVHREEDAAMVYSDVAQIDERGERTGERRLPGPESSTEDFVTLLLQRLNFIPSGSCVTIRRDTFEAVGGFDPQYLVSPDFDFYYRVGRSYRVSHIPEPLTERRRHEDNSVFTYYQELYDNQCRILAKHAGTIPPGLRKACLRRVNRTRASRELQQENARATIRYGLESLRSGPLTADEEALKGVGLTALGVLELVSGPAHLGRYVYRQR